MAVPSACRMMLLMLFSTGVLLCAASPTRRQFVSIPETTSSDPAEVVTNDGAVWDDNDEFDLDDDFLASLELRNILEYEAKRSSISEFHDDRYGYSTAGGDEDWLNEAIVISPSSIPQQSDYEDYDDDDDYAAKKSNNVVVDLGNDDDVVQQDAEDDDTNGNEAEFLFLPSRDNRLLLQDDDEQGGPIKVRHTGKNSYADLSENTNPKEDSDRQFEFTIDDDDDDDKENEVDGNNDDFILDDSQQKDNNIETMPRHDVHDDDDDDEDDNDGSDDDGDGDFAPDADGNAAPMFESPEEDSQVIYGDHVFLY